MDADVNAASLTSPRPGQQQNITLAASTGQYSDAVIRVGSQYQATAIPDFQSPPAGGQVTDERIGKPVWRPTRLKPATVDSFLAKGREAFESTGTPDDAALTHLHNCGYNTKPALHQLRQDNARALPPDLEALNRMTTDDINSFEKAVGQVGKNFHDIALRMEYTVPIPTLILFYFARWKGTEAFEKWKESWNQWKNNDSCYVCGQTSCSVENFLLCCDGCPLAYHNLCCDPPVAKDDVPEDSWYCQHCRSAKPKGKSKEKRSAPTVPVQSWKENSKLEVRHEATQRWFAASIVMVSKKRVKITYDGWDHKYDEWVKKTAALRLAPLGTHVAKDSPKEVPDFARPQSLPTKLKTRNFVRKPGNVRIRVEHLEDAEANYAREWIRAAKNVLNHQKGQPYVPVVLQKPRPVKTGHEDDSEAPSGGTAAEPSTGSADDAVEAAASSADATEPAADAPSPNEGAMDETTDADQHEEAGSTGAASAGPNISEVADLLEKIKDITAHIDVEAELVTLEDAALEWLARASQTSILGSPKRQERKSQYDAVVALLEDADKMCLDLDGASDLREAVADTDAWVKRVQGMLEQEHCEEGQVHAMQQASAELKVDLLTAEDLSKQLGMRLDAQQIDAKIKLALQVPTKAADLVALYKRAKAVHSKSAIFTELGHIMEQTEAWQARAQDALMANSCTIAEMRTLVEEGKDWASRRVLVDGVEELELSITGAEKWLETAENIEWDNPDMADLRAVQKASIQLGVKAKIPELEKVRDIVERANTWLGDYRRLVPKRVNKKELHRLSTIEDLQQLVLKADSVGVRMEEVQQLKDVVTSSTAVLAKIGAALAEVVDDGGEEGRQEYIKSLKELVKEGENTPVKIAALDDLRTRIKDIEFQEAWEARVEEAMERGKLSEAKLQSLLLEGGKLIGESEELRDLQELDRELCVWREKVESTIDSRQADRIAVLEGLEKQASEIEIDFTNSELMDRLAEALKTYCICGGKDDDTFMIQCDDCEDWFHGRCVHVEEFKGVECIEKAVEEMVFVCPRCCDKREKSYRFHPEYNRPEDTDSMEKHRRSRQQRARLLKERRRHMAEAAENKSKKRARKPAAPQATANKKPKMDMHDAELFVDRIKRRFAQSLEKYEKFLQILQEYAKKERSLESVYDCIGELFDGHADLQAEFVNFLPKKMQSAKLQTTKSQEEPRALDVKRTDATVQSENPVATPSDALADKPADAADKLAAQPAAEATDKPAGDAVVDKRPAQESVQADAPANEPAGEQAVSSDAAGAMPAAQTVAAGPSSSGSTEAARASSPSSSSTAGEDALENSAKRQKPASAAVGGSAD